MAKGMQATASKGSGQSGRGLDYTPQRPATKEISYGIAPRVKAGRRQTVHEIVDRRLSNFEAGEGPPLSREITCDNDILLSRYAPDWCRSYRGICDQTRR